jgi:twitching motility two-component system response regulator PilH
MNRILLVEDSPTQAYTTTKMLEKNGYTVIHVANGQDALNCALEQTPDLVIMDIVMADGNGFEATRKLARNESTRHIPVVMLSSKDQATDRLWAKRQGAKEYLVKPVQEQDLVKTISGLLNVSKVTLAS